MDAFQYFITSQTGSYSSYNIVGTENNTAGPSIAHLETQYSWAQIRLAATSLGSRPTGMERRPRSRHTQGSRYTLQAKDLV